MKTIQIAAILALAGGCWPATSGMLINGAGATFPAPIYVRWFSDFQKTHPRARINYQPLGSGAGIKQITEGTVDFGASDAPMTDAQQQEFQRRHGYAVLHFPTVAGAAVPAYNIPGVGPGLKFTARALSGIYLGTITRWNDPELVKVNSGVKLPAADIVVVHRSDGSGTTYCWTDYLSKVSSEWQSKGGRGASINWPTGLGAKGNEGVSGQIQNTPNSIGYVELIYAVQNKLPYGSVQNAAGVFVQASLASVTAAAAGAAQTVPEDFRVSITNAPGREAYPISTFTWLLVPERIEDPEKLDTMKTFLEWMLTTGQNTAASLTYARLPAPVVAKEQKAIARLRGAS